MEELSEFTWEEMASVSVLSEDRFRSNVEKVREEIGRKFAKAHQVLGERETELLSQLDQLEERYRGEGINEQIEDLNQLKEMQLAKAKINNIKDLVLQHVSELDDHVKKLREDLEKERASMRRVELEWDAQLEAGLSKLGAIRLSSVRDYKEIENPVIVAGRHSEEKSKSAGMFCDPRSIAIHPETNNVYVCDDGNHRVQVFTKYFEFLFDFSEKMNLPCGICISNNSVYVTQYMGHCLNEYTAEGMFLKSVGKKGKKKLEFSFPRGVAASNDKNRIYICDSSNNRIQCSNLNLTFNSVIPEIPKPLDIKITTEEIVVLTEGEHLIRYYNYTHQLIRKIIPIGEGGHVTHPHHFCLDAKQNILITDWTAHYVLIFTSKGELIHKFGREGTGIGELYKPRGIAVDSENRIIVASHNPNYVLQLF